MVRSARKQATYDLGELLVPEGDADRVSGVHIAAPRAPESEPCVDESLEIPPSQRPTRPPPPRAVTAPPATVPNLYARIVSERLTRLVPAITPMERAQRAARNVTRNLFAAVGSLDRVPERTCSVAEVREAAIGPRHAFVLGLVDGTTPVESIVDASSMPMDHVLLTLTELVAAGLIRLRP